MRKFNKNLQNRRVLWKLKDMLKKKQDKLLSHRDKQKS
jgi:hypothetical protein